MHAIKINERKTGKTMLREMKKGTEIRVEFQE
jgi:hypothetical protein